MELRPGDSKWLKQLNYQPLAGQNFTLSPTVEGKGHAINGNEQLFAAANSACSQLAALLDEGGAGLSLQLANNHSKEPGPTEKLREYESQVMLDSK